MADCFEDGQARPGALTGLQPIGDCPLRNLRRSVVLCDQPGLAFRDLPKTLFQGFSDRAVVLATPAQQQRLIGCILDQRMAKHIPVRRRACGQHDLRGDQPAQLDSKRFRRLSGYRAQQRRPEPAPDGRSDLGKQEVSACDPPGCRG